MNKYYIEIVDTSNDNELYAIQSKWFNTEKEAIEWFESNFDYIDRRFVPYVMTSEFCNEDEYEIVASEDIVSAKNRYKGEKA